LQERRVANRSLRHQGAGSGAQGALPPQRRRPVAGTRNLSIPIRTLCLCRHDRGELFPQSRGAIPRHFEAGCQPVESRKNGASQRRTPISRLPLAAIPAASSCSLTLKVRRHRSAGLRLSAAYRDNVLAYSPRSALQLHSPCSGHAGLVQTALFARPSLQMDTLEGSQRRNGAPALLGIPDRAEPLHRRPVWPVFVTVASATTGLPAATALVGG